MTSTSFKSCLVDVDSSDKLSVLVRECNSVVVEYKECNDMEFIVKLTPEVSTA